MNMKNCNIKAIVLLLVLTTMGWFQLNGAPAQDNTNAKVPVIIVSSAYQHVEGLEADAKTIIKKVRNEFDLQKTHDKYHRAMIDVIDENADNEGDFLIVYLLPKNNYNTEVSKVTLGADYNFVGIVYGYQLKAGDYSSDRIEAVRACNCPDETVEILLSTCETGIPTAVSGINNIYDTAVNAGYKAKKLMGSEENSTNINNWLCCANLKMWGRIGHGLTTSIQLADGNLSYTYFNNLPAGQLQGKVMYWNSCQVFNNPMKNAVLGAGAGKFIGGICNLYIGSSEEVFKCWSTKNMTQVSPPAGTTDVMCHWVSSCESSTGYPELGCHGCGGTLNVFPTPGGTTTYTLTTGTSGQGSVSLNPSGGSYAAGTSVTVTASASTGWSFDHWSGDLSGTTNPATITMDSDKSVTANFVQVSTPPVADFYADSTNVNVNQSVSFTDTSTLAPTSWSWDFGDGGTSTQQNPSHTYTSAGTYTVALTATNAFGSDTETKTNYITVTVPSITYCDANATDQNYEYIGGVSVADLNKTSGASGYSDFTSNVAHLTSGGTASVTLTPTFASSSYSEAWKIWIDWNKDGDFSDSGEEVFAQTGSSAVSGSFSVPSGLNVTTRMRVIMKYSSYAPACGSFQYGEVEDYTVSVSGTVIDPPTAQFSASPTTITEGDTVTFTDQSTNNPTSWSWDFGDGGTSTAQNPTHVYTTFGNYTVTLTVTNSAGSDTETKTNYITAQQATINYCSVSASNQNYEYIAGVNIGNINKTSGASGYSDFTGDVINVTKGSSVSVSLTPGFASGSYTEYWKVWVDWNKDGDFNDSGEEVFSNSGSSAVSGSFTVPSSAITGTTRVRVIMQYGSSPAACTSFNYGEVEDYSISIQ